MTTTTAAVALDVWNPADGRLVASLIGDDRDTVNAIAADLRSAQVQWAECGPRERARWL
ncbi:MAG: aldehyde dehydrogenase, partial [Rhodococcus sp. (in: high G+C Gram-positive bacteria)]